MNFYQKCVLITGGSRGIGKATAIAFARAGAHVVLNFKENDHAAQDTLDQLEGEHHLAIQADITDPDAAKELIDRTVEVYGKLDVLVNNAGIYLAHPIDRVDFEDWQNAWHHTLTLNLQAAANLSFLAAQIMMEQHAGRIINVSSRGAFRGEPEHPAYAASKAGLNAMSQSLAQALGRYNVGVAVVAPGFVQTDMTADLLNSAKGSAIKEQSAWGRVAYPEEIAQTILFLASKEAAFTSGTIVDVNGASYLRS